MLNTFATTLKRHSWTLSLLLHLFLLLSFMFVWLHPRQTQQQESPDVFIPSYLYKQTPSPSPAVESVKQNEQEPKLKEKPTAKEGLATSNNTKMTEQQITSRANRARAQLNEMTETEPVHLIGDKNVNQPLLVLLGKAIYRHLIFPKSAIDFNIRGISSIGFTVYPNGGISNVSVVKSSGADVLDRAALTAIMQISPVSQVDQYIKEPTYLVANIIFR